MTEIFISYSRDAAGAASAAAVARYLEARGHQVFVESLAERHEQPSAVVERRLEGSRIVVALWSESPAGVGHERHEQLRALREDKALYPVLIGENAKPPLGFGVPTPPRVVDATDPEELAQAFQGLERLLQTGATGREGPRAPAPTSPVRPLLDALVRAVDQGQEVRDIVRQLVARLSRGGDREVPKYDIEDALQLLRNAHRYEAVRDIADTYLWASEASGLGRHSVIRKYYAQALIDLGNFRLARMLLEEALQAYPIHEQKYREASQLLGQVHKEMFVRNRQAAREVAARRSLAEALRHYVAALGPERRASEAPGDIGSNAIALQALSRKMPGTGAPYFDFRAAAREVVQQTGPEAPHRQLGAAAEAHVALEEWPAAAERYARMATHPDVTPYDINRAISQLRELWQVDQLDDPAPAQLVSVLQAALLGRERGQLELRRSDTTAARFEGLGIARAALGEWPHVEAAVEGGQGLHPVEALEGLLRRARSVGAIESGIARLGTGFLVRAGDLLPEAGDARWFLAGGSNLPEIGTAPLQVVFDLASPELRGPFPARVRWGHNNWLSPFAVLELEGLPSDAPVCPVADGPPPHEVRGFASTARPLRLYMLGHTNPFSGVSIALARLRPAPDGGSDLHYDVSTLEEWDGIPLFSELDLSVVGLHMVTDRAEPARAGTAGAPGATGQGLDIAEVRAALDGPDPRAALLSGT